MNRESKQAFYAMLLAIVSITVIMQYCDLKAKDYALATLVGVFSLQAIKEIYTFYDRYISKK